MADGNDRPKQKQQPNAAYTMHPYFYQSYYASQQMAGSSYAPMVAHGATQQQYAWPGYPAGYVAAMPMGQVAGYYFPYGHPAYAQYAYQVTQQEHLEQPTPDTSAPEVPEPTTVLEPSCTAEEPVMEPIGLVRKVSRGFSKDKSKWRLLSRRPSLPLSGTDEGEDWNLPSSPGRKVSYSVSPRCCGSAFLPDREVLVPFAKKELHLVEALRIMSNELGKPECDKLLCRLGQLEEACRVEMKVLSVVPSRGEVMGLQNPLNSKICYLNSVVQLLVSVSPLMQVMSLALTQGSAGVWTTAFSRIFRHFFAQPLSMGQVPSLLTVKGMDSVLKELGGIGTQQDVAEALGVVLNKLHEEWKHALRNQPWIPIESGSPTNHHGLEEDSIVYKLFRGVRCVNSQLEIFTEIHLAPPSAGTGTSLVDLLENSFKNELHYLPPVLCIELSRHLSENQLTTSQSSVPFSGTMKIPDSCCTHKSSRTYQLIGAVVRSGVYANSGHFWAAQRRGDKWFWINDTDVSECDVTVQDLTDDSNGLISKKLEAATSWCVLVYADPNSTVAIHPYN